MVDQHSRQCLRYNKKKGILTNRFKADITIYKELNQRLVKLDTKHEVKKVLKNVQKIEERTSREGFKMSIINVIFLTDWTIFPCISSDTITLKIIHMICTISTILARLTSTVIDVCVIIKKGIMTNRCKSDATNSLRTSGHYFISNSTKSLIT